MRGNNTAVKVYLDFYRHELTMKSSIFTKKYFRDGKPLTGFTLIELIISIFILSVGIVGIFSAFSIVTILTANTVDQLTASYLAQDGMEIVRNIRDTNWLNMDAGSPANASWVDGLSCALGCEADYTTATNASEAFSMSSYLGRHLCINANGFYYYTNSCSDSSTTKFKRKITITPVTDFDNNLLNPHIIKVTTQVAWEEKATIIHSGYSADYGLLHCAATDNCVTAEETLYDWYNVPSSAKDIKTFTFNLGAGENDQVDQILQRISVIVPTGTKNVTALAATFTTTGSSVTVGTPPAVQYSGTTTNDFTNPVTYTVHASDNTTQDYVVTVTGE